MTNEENENFTFLLEIGEIEQAFEMVPEYAYEAGLSVFDLNADGMPELTNLQLISSLLARINDVAYIVSGEEVKRGNDGEPLIKINKIESEKVINNGDLINYVTSVLCSSFETKDYQENEDNHTNELFQFFSEYKVNKKTGEKINRWQPTYGDEWEILPGIDEYQFNGWTFSNPIAGFDVNLGFKY